MSYYQQTNAPTQLLMCAVFQVCTDILFSVNSGCTGKTPPACTKRPSKKENNTKTERQEASSEDDIEETKSNRPYNPKLVSSGIFDDENDDPNHSIAAFFETPSTIICKQSKASRSASSPVNSTS